MLEFRVKDVLAREMIEALWCVSRVVVGDGVCVPKSRGKSFGKPALTRF
jgi:hypothetical protein